MSKPTVLTMDARFDDGPAVAFEHAGISCLVHRNVPVRVAAFGGTRYRVRGKWCTEERGGGDELFPKEYPAGHRRIRRGSLGDPGGHRALKATGSEVHVLYVLPSAGELIGPHSYPTDRRESLLEQAERDARTFLDEQAERISSEGGKVAETHLRRGRADKEVVRISEELDAGMIVLGSRGLGAVRRSLMGSVSDSVVRHAHCPVFVIRRDEARS